MKIRDTLGMLVGGGIVYVAMATTAACSSGGGIAGSSGGSGGHHVASGSGGAQGAGGQHGAGGDDGGIFDALTDPVPEAAAEPVSGSRLKAKYQVSDDGLKIYLPGSYYDSERGEDCIFEPAADGKERCLPIGSGATAGTYFLDPSCTQDVALAFAGCVTKYAYTVEQSACSLMFGKIHIYPTGAPLQPAQVYHKSGASCVGTAPPENFTLLSVGAEVPASSFVAGSVQHD